MKEICELLNELDAGKEKFFIDRRTRVNGVITLHTPQEEIEKLFVKLVSEVRHPPAHLLRGHRRHGRPELRPHQVYAL